MATKNFEASLGGSFECTSDYRLGGFGFDPCQVWQHSFVEIDLEIFSRHFLPSADSRKAVVSFWQRMYTSIGKLLRGLSLRKKVWLGKLVMLDMPPMG